MSRSTIEDQIFNGPDSIKAPFEEAYENCEFNQCAFTNANFSNIRFVECRFSGCDFSNANLDKTTLNDVKFAECKMLGLHFDACSEFLFGVSFEKCVINFSSFFKRNLKSTLFNTCSLQDVDFTEADLTSAVFDNCDLARAVFEGTILQKADFRTAYNYAMDPEVNKLKKARFGMHGVSGLLTKYDIVVE